MNSAQAKTLAELLKEMRGDCGDYCPEEVWPEFHKTVALPYVELVIPRRVYERWEIFLIHRPSSDPHWPSMWHLPGGVWRTRQTEAQACESVARRELGVGVTDIQEVMTFRWPTHPYGNPTSHICIFRPPRKLVKASDRGYFARLPKTFIPEQIKFVKEAVSYLRAQNWGGLTD